MELIYNLNDKLSDLIFMLGQFGIFGAIIMPLLEAVFPSLPIIAIAGINVRNFGLLGYLYTYIGSVLGTLLVFWCIRKLFTKRFLNSKIYKKNKVIHKFIDWMEKSEPAKSFILFCMPFLPTCLLNYACALSKMEIKKFVYLIIFSRIVAIIMYSYLGESILSIVNHPIKGLIACIMLVVVYVISKFVEKIVTKEHENE
ncbi:MAG: VTT domain-containing protein [Bacilli bacterium]|jgi:uncharacterized membrane protein YdjX (TVP38/TMEM64 family)|nr:VTT domain-containing protein [Bacilli bacterium]